MKRQILAASLNSEVPYTYAPRSYVANLYQDAWELRKRILKMGVVIRIGDDQPKEVKREWEEQQENYLNGSM